ncbi:MAG: hypothetical protein PHC39_04545 [Proteiniphilum sp.]|nr:hypothetical protein [Proteiniphilum sp.]
MAWINHKYKGSGGIDKVSAEIGAEIYTLTCLHDDGVKGYGGMRVACVGPMRQGKTTLGVTTLPMIHYIPTMEKEKFLKNPNRDLSDMHKETIVYRGRKLDYWNAYTKQNFDKCFPNMSKRELRVFIWYEDDILFYEEMQEENIMKQISGLDVYKYKSQEDLYNNLIEGGINVVYVPNDYKLSILLKNKLNEMRMLKPEDKDWYTQDMDISVINETFWYDLFYYMQEIENSRDEENPDEKRRLKSISFFFDEAHQIFPANEPKPFWYLIDDFAENALIDTGRMNMTLYANIHALNLMYWKVLQRFDTFIWLGGSKPDKSYSMVSDKVTRALKKGMFIIEEKQKRFGKMTFNRIPNQPYTVLAKGVT